MKTEIKASEHLTIKIAAAEIIDIPVGELAEYGFQIIDLSDIAGEIAKRRAEEE